MKKTILLIICCLLILSAPVLAMGQPIHPPTLLELQTKITAELNSMDQDIAKAALILSDLDLTSATVRPILEQLYDDHLAAVDCVAVSPTGILLTIEPDKYRYSEGSDVSQQEHIIKMAQEKKPVLSRSFKTVEGFWAVTLAHPVFSPTGDFKGSVSLVIKPDAMLRNIIKDYPPDNNVIMLIDSDGRLLFDKDILQVGKMTFSDPLYQDYPSVIDFAKKVTAEAVGTGSYQYLLSGTNNVVKKNTEWLTVGLYNTNWRLVVSKSGQ